MENWKKIKGYENYLVSDQGRVFNLKYKRFRKLSKNRGGYLYVNLCKNGVRKSQKVQRLVANAFIPNPENKRTVNHIDGCKANNHVENLEWATYSENLQHAFDNGLKKPPCLKGIKNGRAKLTEKEVLEIRRLYKTGDYTQRGLGKMFGVSKLPIGHIVNRKIWKHI